MAAGSATALALGRTRGPDRAAAARAQRLHLAQLDHRRPGQKVPDRPEVITGPGMSMATKDTHPAVMADSGSPSARPGLGAGLLAHSPARLPPPRRLPGRRARPCAALLDLLAVATPADTGAARPTDLEDAPDRCRAADYCRIGAGQRAHNKRLGAHRLSCWCRLGLAGQGRGRLPMARVRRSRRCSSGAGRLSIPCGSTGSRPSVRCQCARLGRSADAVRAVRWA